ncbi:AraC-like DNA-binding protein [Pseudomonas sp. TE3786]
MRRIDTIATWAQVIVRALEAEGIASAPLLCEAGIDASTLHDANQRIAQANMTTLWRAALRVSGDPCFGLRVARSGYPTDFHGLFFAMQNSYTLIEALERSVRFSSVISTSAVMQVQRLPHTTRLIYGVAEGVDVERIATEAFIACAVQFTQQTWRDIRVIKQVCLTRATPEQAQRWEQILGCPVQFDAAVNAIEYHNAALLAPLRTGNSDVARGLDTVMSDYLERQRRSNLPERVRSVIVRQLPFGEVQQSKVADELGMSVRNLHRHLNKHASSFKDLLDESRRQLAITYLRQSHCSINEICYRLGFNEPSSFNRAFRRWTGSTPGQWRREELTQSAAPVVPQRLKPTIVMSPLALAV